LTLASHTDAASAKLITPRPTDTLTFCAVLDSMSTFLIRASATLALIRCEGAPFLLPFLLATNGGADVVITPSMPPEITTLLLAPSFNFCRSWIFCFGLTFHSFSLFRSASAKKACITSQSAFQSGGIKYSF
jgi:hypothetical protein